MNYSEISTHISSHIAFSNFLTYESRSDLVNEVFEGLSAKQKYLSSRFFYNDYGSSLFEEITCLPEYYPTRTEKSILHEIAAGVMTLGKGTDIIELGSGDCSKISILLDAVSKNQMESMRYIPVDVSKAAILKSADLLSLKYPGIKIHGILADFMKHLKGLPGERNRLICFFGSTLGNLTSQQANRFLMELKDLMQPGDRFLLGLDMIKDIRVLEDAYNDKQGITAAFNKNILRVINSIVKTDFDPDLFEHMAFYNPDKSGIEMHLKALHKMTITSPIYPQKIDLAKGETIHTENSHKFSIRDILEFADNARLEVKDIYTDKKGWFSITQFKCMD